LKSAKEGFGIATEVGRPANRPGGAGKPGNRGWAIPVAPGIPGSLGELVAVAAFPSVLFPLNPWKFGNCLCSSAKGSPKTLDNVLGVIRVSVTLCLLFLGVTTSDKASSCSGGDKSDLATGDGDEWCSSSLWLLLMLPVEVAEDGIGRACCRSPGAGLSVGGRGNADDVGMVVTGVVIFGVVGLYMDTGPRPEDRGAERSLTCGARPEGV